MISTLFEVIEFLHLNQNKYQQALVVEDSLIFIDEISDSIKEKEKVLSSRLLHSLKELKRNITTTKLTSSFDLDRTMECMKEVDQFFKTDIKIEYKVVFFAELGEKWDAMESVYKAFERRHDCKVDVVLTPIFRNVNIAGEMKTNVIYEDYLTDLGISFIHYKDYNINDEQPDMAFISNPYESVTTPDFWPENIAKATRLVFLPYYTEMVINSETITRNCRMPMAENSWKIIAQSDVIKELHEEYSLLKGRNVVVTGLPKWDSAKHYRSDTLNAENIIYDEWAYKLEGKVVFLWNSHYNIHSSTSTLLQYGEHIINLIEGNEDVAMIWRPHPMTETIIKLYMQEYQGKWESMLERVKESSNIVLDENKIVDFAFNYSNALISDYSSIIPQYIFTQKPILFLTKDDADLDDDNKIVHYDLLPKAKEKSQINEFIESICNGRDDFKKERYTMLKNDFPNNGEDIGEKICDLLIKDLYLEM